MTQPLYFGLALTNVQSTLPSSSLIDSQKFPGVKAPMFSAPILLVLFIQTAYCQLLEVSLHPSLAVIEHNNTRYAAALNDTSPGVYVNVDIMFPPGIISPNAFITLSRRLLDLPFSHALFFQHNIRPELLSRLRAFFPSISSLDRAAVGLVQQPQRFFVSSFVCSPNHEAACAHWSGICAQFGVAAATCIGAYAFCVEAGYENNVPNRGYETLEACALNHAYGRIMFEEAYGTPTNFVSLADKSPAFLLSRTLLQYFVSNADVLNLRFPSLGVALGQWLAPVEDVHFLDVADLLFD